MIKHSLHLWERTAHEGTGARAHGGTGQGARLGARPCSLAFSIIFRRSLHFCHSPAVQLQGALIAARRLQLARYSNRGRQTGCVSTFFSWQLLHGKNNVLFSKAFVFQGKEDDSLESKECAFCFQGIFPWLPKHLP